MKNDKWGFYEEDRTNQKGRTTQNDAHKSRQTPNFGATEESKVERRLRSKKSTIRDKRSQVE